MQIKLTLDRGSERASRDIVVTADTRVTVGDLAERIAGQDPPSAGAPAEPTLRIVEGHGRILDPDLGLVESGLVSGARVELVERGDWADQVPEGAAATLRVVAGPDAGSSFPLRAGSNQVGRGTVGNDVALTDPQVSKVHARINVADVVEVVDLGSSNGVYIGDVSVQRAVIRPEDEILLGESLVRVVQHHDGGLRSAVGVLFNRSPRIDEVYPGIELEAPEPPEEFRRQRTPVIPMMAPVLFGIVMFAVTRQLVTVLFVALSPLMMVGNVLESRIFGRREHEKACEAFRAALGEFDAVLTAAAGTEASVRREEHPDPGDVVRAAIGRERALWSRRPDARGFLDVRLGLGSLPTRNVIDHRPKHGAVAELADELRAVIASHATVPAVPVVARLGECGSLGVAGPRDAALAAARSALAQVAALQSPAEVVVAAVVPAERAEDWADLKWLPHTSSAHSPIGRDAPHLASSPGGVEQLVSLLEEVVTARIKEDIHVPSVVLVVEDDAPIERSRLVGLGERGRRCGIHLLWLAPTTAALPAACRTYVELDPNRAGLAAVGYVDGEPPESGGLRVEDVDAELLAHDRFAELSRSLCPLVDAGARVDDDSDLPSLVSLPSLSGMDLLDSTESVLDRWRTSNSLPSEVQKRRKPNHLRTVVGSAAAGPMVLDLREHGPHALVGGTTGAGKSEFLQSWIVGMALEHSPARVNFLFVDYKGGAAFADCVDLPHCVGLVTDLSPHLVDRALTSLNAELRHREELLNRKRKKDLVELEKDGDTDTPPSLVIVVDEFAALVQEVPEFVDGVINVAQRGRSLGLHLVLATQRPAGVITGNLRANTNLRIALRVADETDSEDVVGSAVAASFDPGTPGRAVAKTGPGRLVPFQSSYVGGHTSHTPPPPTLDILDLVVGVGTRWEEPGDGEADDVGSIGQSDLRRLVERVRSAADAASIPAPRRPWLDELAPVYDLANLPSPSRSDAVLTFGILDDPERQAQYPVSFRPDVDGNMAVIGTGGSGKSAFLRTIAVVAGLGFRGGPCHVYGLDFGARGLSMLEPLPHVGSIITGDDTERTQRLLRDLRSEIDARAERYAKVRASTVADYRRLADAPDEPRIVVLLDNISGFRSGYEVGPLARYFDMLLSIAADGRPVGVHLVISADRPGAIPSALSSVIQRQLVLRLASENDLMTAGVPAGWFAASTPPGRGYFHGNNAQVLVLGGSGNTSRQSEAIDRLAEQLVARGERTAAPPVRSLPELVRLDDLPATVDGRPVVGLSGDSLGPLPIATDDVFLVAGPSQSGRTTAMATVLRAVQRAQPGADLVYLGQGRSFLRGMFPWSEEAIGEESITAAALDMTSRVKSGWAPAVIVVEDHASFLNSTADQPLVDLITACRSHDVLVLVDGELGGLGSWPLQMAAKAGRHGIILQPDQHDGEQVYKTPLPRVQRSDFPAGRGFYIRAGRAHLLQVAMPE